MSNLAGHIAIIMDGNGRWAAERGLKRANGHEKGAEVVRNITKFCSTHKDVERLTLYAFSTENWKRPKIEIEFLMKLLQRYLKNELDTYLENNIRFEPIGDLSRFSASLLKTIDDVCEKTAHCDGLVQSLALNYGSKDELVRGVRSLVENNIEITEKSIDASLDCQRDVDLLIRTGGNRRLSNFMLWQSAYAELFFTDTLWPDFTSNELKKIIDNFTTVERRFGGLK